MLLKGVELGNILILLAIVVVAIVIVRAALQDDREVCTFASATKIMTYGLMFFQSNEIQHWMQIIVVI